MSRQRKVTGPKDGRGGERCPHCGRTLPPRKGDDGRCVSATKEERHAIVCRAMARVCTREELLNLLAHYQPALRALVADVYPLSVNEELTSHPADSGGIPRGAEP